MIDIGRILDEALTIPPDKAGPVELKLRDALAKRKDCKHEDVIVKCCRSDEKSGKVDSKQLLQTYVLGLGNIIDLLKVYDKCKNEYIQQSINKKVTIERADGKTVDLDPLKDLNKISRLTALKQFIDKFEKLVSNDTSVSTSFKKYAINDHDRKCIRLMCWNENVMVWGTKEFEPSQKFAVQLWQNIETIDSGSAYGDPDTQCPYCTHSKNHWESHAGDDLSYEQYWYLAIPDGVSCTKRGDLTVPEVVNVYNKLKGAGPDILICQHDSDDDWCDRDDNPISEYGVDIQDANEIIYINDDGEVTDYDGDEDLEEIEFNFSTPSGYYFDDVVELYLKWFVSIDRSQNLPQQPWERSSDYQARRNKKAEFIKFRGDQENDDGDEDRKFDFDVDVWEHSIFLDDQHFTNGILNLKLPQITNCSIIKVANATIYSFAGFPKDILGNTKRLVFDSCKLLGASGWSPSNETKTNIHIEFENCVFGPDFKLGDVLGGASVTFLGIKNSPKNPITDFKFLGGQSKFKNIKHFLVQSENIQSFVGVAESIENDEIDIVDIGFGRWLNTITRSAKIKNFAGLPAKVGSLTIKCEQITAEALKNINEVFPGVQTNLEFNISHTDSEIVYQLFRTAWIKTQNHAVSFKFIDLNHSHFNFVLPTSHKTLNEDKTPSVFKGLPKRSFKNTKLAIKLSERNKYEYGAFILGNEGFKSGTFNPDDIPLFKYADRVFTINCTNALPEFIQNHVMLGMVLDGRIHYFDKNLELVAGPFDKDQWKFVCFDSGEDDPKFDLDEVLKVFLATRKTDFPKTKLLMFGKNFTGQEISNINEPGLSLGIPRRGAPNLNKISNCNIANFVDYRIASQSQNNESKDGKQMVFQDCELEVNGKLCAKEIRNCIIKSPDQSEENLQNVSSNLRYEMLLQTENGIFDSKIVYDNHKQRNTQYLNIDAPTIEGCSITQENGGGIKINSVNQITGSNLTGESIVLEVSPEFTISSDSKLKVTQSRLRVFKHHSGGKTNDDEIASSVLRSLDASSIKFVDFGDLRGIVSLKFLEELSPQVQIEVFRIFAPPVENFRFKLKKAKQISALVASMNYYLKTSPKATLDGFDASVAFALDFYQQATTENSKLIQQLDSYFIAGPSFKEDGQTFKTKVVDPNYVDKNGQFAAPKTIDERLFGQPTTTEEKNWLNVIKLFR